MGFNAKAMTKQLKASRSRRHTYRGIKSHLVLNERGMKSVLDIIKETPEFDPSLAPILAARAEMVKRRDRV